MRTASRVFYLLTGILSLIAFVLLLVFGILGLVGSIPEFKDIEWLMAVPIVLIVYAAFEFIAALIGFHGNKLSRKGSPKKGFHIFCIVISVIFWNPFLLLAGIFGLVGAATR